MARTRQLNIVLIYQCFNCDREFKTEAAAKECCQFTRKFYKCLGCGEQFMTADRKRAVEHGKRLAENGFCEVSE